MKVEAKTREHRYAATLVWTGASEGATRTYDGYSRAHEVRLAGKATLALSSDATFRGDARLHNPEELLVASLVSCHMLAYFALCARERIAVVAYEDAAEGTMLERAGAGRFASVVLRPIVTIDDERVERAIALHDVAHGECFIANSVNFPVTCEPTIRRVE